MRVRHETLLAPLAALLCVAALAACGGTTRPGRTAPPDITASSLVTARLGAVAFTSPARGFGAFVLTRDGGNVCQAAVGMTTDGGAVFGRPGLADTWPCADGAPWNSLAADSGGDVFLFGPQLFISHDRGVSWRRARPGGQVLAIAAAGRSVWLLLARCGGRGQRPDQCPVRLLVSANGGRTWRAPATQPAGAAVRGYGPQAIGPADLVRTGAASGYVLLPPDPNPRGMINAARLWVTRNGGARWVRGSVRCGLDGLSGVLAVAPDGTIFVACAGEPGAGLEAKAVVRSVDGGRTWTEARPCAPMAALGCPPLNFGYLGQIAATSARTVYLAGDRGSLMVSHDGGQTWRPVRPLIGDTGGGTFQLGFFGAVGFVFGDDGRDGELPAIWHTTDGGARWRVVHPVIR